MPIIVENVDIDGGFSLVGPNVTIPDPPTIGTVTTSEASALVPFTAPLNDGGSAIVSYTAVSTPGNITGTLNQPGSGTITVNGLTKGTSYTFVVYATNGVGNSNNSATSNSIIPLTVPGAPTNVSATAGDTQATVTFTSPTDTGGTAITTYTVTSTPDNITASGSTSPIIINGLTNETSYTFNVTATNSVGTGSASAESNSVTPQAPALALYSWGLNDFGQLALNDGTTRSSPAQVSISWATISGGAKFALGLKSDGTLYSWGRNIFGTLGINLPTGQSRSSPVQIAGSYIQITTGTAHAFAIQTNNTLWGWGLNQSGQLGDNSTVNKSTPVQITGSWSSISAGDTFTLALDMTNKLYSWGGNDSYTLGDGTTVNKSSPVAIGTRSYNLISAGYDHSLAIDDTNKLFSWGNNLYGQLGTYDLNDITEAGKYSFIQIAGNPFYNNYAIIRSDYTLWVWGTTNTDGQLGDGTTVAKTMPVQIPGSWSQVSMAIFHTAGIQTNGTLWCWGRNLDGQIGVSDKIYRSSPVQVSGGGSWFMVSCGGGGNGLTMAIKDNSPNRSLYGWGYNGNGEFGNNNTTSASSPVLARTAGGSTTGWFWVHVANNLGATFAIRGDGTMNNAGQNAGGVLGDGTTINRIGGTTVAGSWLMVNAGNYSAYAIRSNNTLWSWGRNFFGGLGIGNTLDRSSPVQVAGSWLNISSGYETFFGIKNDNTLWGWGRNVSPSALPINATTSRSSPVQIGSTITWNQNSISKNTYIGAKDINGKLYLWGAAAQIIDPRIPRSNPTLLTYGFSQPLQIGSSNWTTISAGMQHSLAIASTNMLFAWGKNLSGQLGDSTTLSKSDPVQIGSNSWTLIKASTDFSLAINTSNQLHAWGLNSSGQLGDNNVVSKSSPTVINSGVSYTFINAGSVSSYGFRY